MFEDTKSYYSEIFVDYPDVVDVEQMAKMLGVCTKTAYKLLRDKTVKSIRIGRSFKIPKWNVIIYLLENT